MICIRFKLMTRVFRRLYFFVLLLIPFFCFAELPDPTRPPPEAVSHTQTSGEEAAPTQPEFLLQAVLHSKTRNVAVINGQLVQTGDNINGYVVHSIEATKVQLQGPHGTQDVPLFTEEIKFISHKEK